MNGLQQFKNYFADYSSNYTLIGGMACFLAMEEAGVEFRATKDFDIVLTIEALDKKFVSTFWQFIKDGAYEVRQKSNGNPEFYRFLNPKDSSFPKMIELFSKEPDLINIVKGSQLTPVPVADELSSLSAILLDEGYYGCLKTGTILIDSINILKPEYIMVFKAKAWLDLSDRKEKGERVDSKNIKKHLNDVLRLFTLLLPNQKVDISEPIKQDFKEFLNKQQRSKVKPKDLKINMELDEIIESIKVIFNIT